MNPERRRTLAVIAAAAAGAATFLVTGEASGEPNAERIVVAGGDLTEIVFALGRGDRVVGVDQTSTWPPEAVNRSQIGYVRRISPEGILSLAPDLVLAAHDAGPEIAFEQLAAAGVRIARAPEAKTADQIAGKIAFVGRALGRSAEAEQMARQVSEALDEIRAKIATLEGRRPRVLFILSFQSGAPLIGGTETTADRMITLAGGENAGASVSGYKPMSREAIIAAAQDIVLMMSQHAERFGGIDTILARPEIALTPAGQAGRAVAMDGMLLLGFGPRTPQAITELARALHAERAVAAGL
ncbi:MAG: ABC transporter substrate-binding protein [Pseudomonadota bacterium]